MHSLLFGGSVGSDAYMLLYGTIFTFLSLIGIFRWLNSILFYSHFINRKYRFSIPDLLLYWLSSLAACRQTYPNSTFLFLNMECCHLSKFGDTTVAQNIQEQLFRQCHVCMFSRQPVDDNDSGTPIVDILRSQMAPVAYLRDKGCVINSVVLDQHSTNEI